MSPRPISSLCLWMGLWLAAGCGGGGQASPSMPQASPPASGGEQPAAVTEPAQAPEPAVPSGPAAVTVEVKVHGKPAAAEVKLLGADGTEVASGAAGEPLQATSGEYTMLVSITDAKALLDKPTQRRPLTLHAGDDLHEVVEFPWAMVQLNVMINGRAAGSATVHLMRQGAEIGMIKSGADFTPISPGRYQAEVKTAGASIKVEGLMFPEGATQTIPVHVKL